MEKIITCVALVCMAIALIGCANQKAKSNWKDTLEDRVPAYGHRNWIVVADSAYPQQSAPGIETIYTGLGQVELLEKVLEAIDGAPHIQGVLMLDAELESIPENLSPGISKYKADLKKITKGRNVIAMPHEDIIAKMDETAKMFNILLLKSDMILPYTSVFIQLDCGYWSPETEEKLRSLMESSK